MTRLSDLAGILLGGGGGSGERPISVTCCFGIKISRGQTHSVCFQPTLKNHNAESFTSAELLCILPRNVCGKRRGKDPMETQHKNEFTTWQSEKSHVPGRLCTRRRDESRAYLIKTINTAYRPFTIYTEEGLQPLQ